MTEKKLKKSKKLNKLDKNILISFVAYLLSALIVLAFGIYFREIFEIVGGLFLAIYGLNEYIKNKDVKNKSLILKREKKRFNILAILIIVFSLINPFALLALIFDLYKREWIMDGVKDEE